MARMRHLLSARVSHTRFSLTGGLLWTLPLIKRLLSKDQDRSIHIVRSTTRISRNTAISRHISCSVRSPLPRSISFPCSRARFSLVPFPLRSRGSVRARPSTRRWIGPSRLSGACRAVRVTAAYMAAGNHTKQKPNIKTSFRNSSKPTRSRPSAPSQSLAARAKSAPAAIPRADRVNTHGRRRNRP
jgi:hypothetical protein